MPVPVNPSAQFTDHEWRKCPDQPRVAGASKVSMAQVDFQQMCGSRNEAIARAARHVLPRHVRSFPGANKCQMPCTPVLLVRHPEPCPSSHGYMLTSHSAGVSLYRHTLSARPSDPYYSVKATHKLPLLWPSSATTLHPTPVAPATPTATHNSTPAKHHRHMHDSPTHPHPVRISTSPKSLTQSAQKRSPHDRRGTAH